MSSDRGLYVQRLNGEIHTVQVIDSAGNERPVPLHIYLTRQIAPPLGTLPDINDYHVWRTTPFESWAETVRSRLIGMGMDCEEVQRAFSTKSKEIELKYQEINFNDAAVPFIESLRENDLDLQIDFERGSGLLLSQLAERYQMKKEEASTRVQRGFQKRVWIFACFRNDASNFPATPLPDWHTPPPSKTSEC